MFDKILALQQQTEAIKKRLDAITVEADIENAAIKVSANGNKKIQSIDIQDDFFKNADKEALEELLLTVINKVLDKAENLHQTEMQAASRDMMNQMGGLGALSGLFNK